MAIFTLATNVKKFLSVITVLEMSKV